jgi:hypothetical protein
VASASPQAIETGGRISAATKPPICVDARAARSATRSADAHSGNLESSHGRRCTQMDFSLDPVTGGGDGPLGWYIVDVDFSEQFPTRMNTSHIGFRLLVDGVWNGNIDSDDIWII